MTESECNLKLLISLTWLYKYDISFIIACVEGNEPMFFSKSNNISYMVMIEERSCNKLAIHDDDGDDENGGEQRD